MSESNVEVVRKAWEGWLREGWSGLVEYQDPEIIWDTSHFPDWPESSYHGIQGVERFLSEWLEVWGDYEAGVETILSAPDGRVFVICWQRGKGSASGLGLEMRSGQIYTVRNGKITRVDNYQDPDEAFEAAGI